MSSEARRHIPVLKAEVLEVFTPLGRPDRPLRLLDGTLGLGGHTAALLEAIPSLSVLGLDRDAEALSLAAERLAPFGDRVRTCHCRFSRFAEAMDRAGWDRADAVLVDLGVSSLQLDEAARGFSVHGDGPLDMRMDPSSGAMSAAELVNRADFRRLRDLIAQYGEDPQAGRIARAICRARERAPLRGTAELARVVREAYPPAWREKARRHPATRTFQALRMAVNDEPGELKAFLDGVFSRLSLGGRLCVISFHSLEDRLVKNCFRERAAGCLCPPHVPVCRCGHVPELRLLTPKPLTAGEEELAANPRASSARLRACEKIAERVDHRGD